MPAPDPPEPSGLHRAFTAHRPLDWPDNVRTAAGLADLYGAKAARRSLEVLRRAVDVEPRVTAQFLASLPASASPYHLDRRVKSPESLARKIRTMSAKRKRSQPTDVLRYTALTASPDDLVGATRRTIDALTDNGWQVTSAMQSYVDGSRYKGIHAYLAVPGFDRVEVQFHSAASAKVKELTTRWYEIERSARASDHERAVARQQCVDLSATLRPPAGIEGLTALGGRPVVVNNYSADWNRVSPRHRKTGNAPRATDQSPRLRQNDGRMR